MCRGVGVRGSGGGGNGGMYNASVVHFQLPVAPDAADASISLPVLICLISFFH